MKIIKIIAVILLLALVGVQFIPTNRNRSEMVPATDIMKTYDVPGNVEAILKTSCYDCHSNNTDYPWYNKIQPFSGILEGHITDGKAELNFSEFGTYSDRRQRSKFRSILSQVESGEMPLPSYLWVHREAELSDEEKKILEDWIDRMLEGL